MTDQTPDHTPDQPTETSTDADATAAGSSQAGHDASVVALSDVAFGPENYARSESGHSRLDELVLRMTEAEQTRSTEVRPIPRPISRLADVPLESAERYADWTQPGDPFHTVYVFGGPVDTIDTFGGAVDVYSPDGDFDHRVVLRRNEAFCLVAECTDLDGRPHNAFGPAYEGPGRRDYWLHGKLELREWVRTTDFGRRYVWRPERTVEAPQRGGLTIRFVKALRNAFRVDQQGPSRYARWVDRNFADRP